MLLLSRLFKARGDDGDPNLIPHGLINTVPKMMWPLREPPPDQRGSFVDSKRVISGPPVMLSTRPVHLNRIILKDGTKWPSVRPPLPGFSAAEPYPSRPVPSQT